MAHCDVACATLLLLAQAQEATMLAWSKSGSGMLAVGTAKGNLQLYNVREKRCTPVVGKHTKRVCVGVWNKTVLAMAGLDKTVSCMGM